MKKIKTIFERNWEGDRKIIDKPLFKENDFIEAIATEKLDGTNVKVTIRNHEAVRLEKRRNPNKIQKAKGIEEPWYEDANEFNPSDKWIFDALKNTNLTKISDGEFNGEAVGTKIQGNPLKLENNRIVFFTLGQVPIFDNVPITYQELKEWLPKQISKYGNNCKIEGIVWHKNNIPFGKIKLKDFKY